VLGSQFSQGWPSAFVWQEGNPRQIGVPAGAEAVFPIELNDAGEVLVHAFDAQNPRMMRALVWQDGAWVRTFDPKGQPDFTPSAMNNAGQVLGVSRADGTNFHGVLWDADDNRRDLANLTCGASVGWTLGPQAINDEGQIVGYAWQGDTVRAFLLTPPRA
jgi:probable HAF family extracellular repeat protein